MSSLCPRCPRGALCLCVGHDCSTLDPGVEKTCMEVLMGLRLWEPHGLACWPVVGPGGRVKRPQCAEVGRTSSHAGLPSRLPQNPGKTALTNNLD